MNTFLVCLSVYLSLAKLSSCHFSLSVLLFNRQLPNLSCLSFFVCQSVWMWTWLNTWLVMFLCVLLSICQLPNPFLHVSLFICHGFKLILWLLGFLCLSVPYLLVSALFVWLSWVICKHISVSYSVRNYSLVIERFKV